MIWKNKTWQSQLVSERKLHTMSAIESSRFGTYVFAGVIFNGTDWLDESKKVQNIEWCYGNPNGMYQWYVQMV